MLPYRTGDDRIAGVVLTFVDITDRRNAEDALRESETRFRTIVSQAAAGVAHTDLEGRITLVNARFAQIAGRSAESLAGMSVFDLVHPDDRERNLEAFRRMVADGTPFEMSKRYLRPDGAVVWISTAVTTILDAAGRPTAAIAIVLDITQAKIAEQTLRQSEERLRLVRRERSRVRDRLDGPRSPRHELERRRRGAHRLSRGRGRRSPADVIFTEEDRRGGAPEREAHQALAEGRAADERWHLRKDGSRFWGSGVMMAMRDPGGDAPVGLVKIFRDQTQRGPRRKRSRPAAPSWCRRWSTTARRAPRPRPRATRRTTSSPSSRTSCARR